MDQLKHELPYSVILPDHRERPEFYQTGLPGNRLEISNDMFLWLEETIGFGTEASRPFAKIIEKTTWAVVKIDNELHEDDLPLQTHNRGRIRTFILRFRKQEDAALFRLTWI